MTNASPPTELPVLKSYWTDWTRQRSSLSYLDEWLKRVPFPLAATDLEREAAIRDYLWRTFAWTGQQHPCFRNVDSPVNNLQDQDEFIDKTNINPSWSCGPMSCTMIGLLAARGIMARQVATSHLVTGAVDSAYEFWSPSLGKWVLGIAHLNLIFEDPEAANGIPLSLLEWSELDRRCIFATPISPTGGVPRCVPDAFDCWTGMSRTPRVMRGNFPYAGGETATTPIKPEMWESMPVLPLPPGITLPRTATFGAFAMESVTNPPMV
jgi:hypothetical protein